MAYKEVKRYSEINYDTRTELVVCPKCQKEGWVENQCQGHKYSLGGMYFCSQHGFVFKCYHCMFSQNLAEVKLYRIKVARNCPECANKILLERDGFKEAPTEVEVCCNYCEFKAFFQPNVEQYTAHMDLKGLVGDSVFGYPLWLQIDVKGHLFWAHNRSHLEAIRLYVEADLRERQSPYLMTMVARLPKFIKIAKNRTAILNAISRLQAK